MSKLYEYAAILVVVLSAFACGAFWMHGHDEAETAKAVTKFEQKASVIGQTIQAGIDATHEKIVTVTRTNTVRIPHVVYKIRYKDRVVTRPIYHFSHAEWLCWNASLRVAGAPACPDPTAAGPDAFTATGTTLADAFGNLNINGGICADYKARAEGWQTWWDKVKGATK